LLFQVVAALHAPSGFAGRLHGGEQQANQDPNDRNDNQQFHQRKTQFTIQVFGPMGHDFSNRKERMDDSIERDYETAAINNLPITGIYATLMKFLFSQTISRGRVTCWGKTLVCTRSNRVGDADLLSFAKA
jgi:hypothetical protein